MVNYGFQTKHPNKRRVKYKMENKDIKSLKKQLDEMNIDEVIRGEVKAFGTSAHLNIPKKHIGKKTITLILKNSRK